MVMVGANPDELERMATRLATEARRLEQLGAQLNRQLGAAPWRGAGADRFRAQWKTAHLRHINEAAGFLKHGSDVLVHNARQQREASDASTGSSGGGRTRVPGRFEQLPPGQVDRAVHRLLDAGGDPRAVRRAWDHLSPAEREAVIRAHPGRIGNLDGIPADARFRINRERVLDYIDDLPPGDSMRAKLSPYVDGSAGRSQILFFDPTGDGRIAVVRGDLDHAKSVAVVVPGIGNEMSDIGGLVSDADQLRRTAGDGTAVVAWLGYDTPAGPPDPKVIAAAGTAMALAGAPLLVSLVGGLRTESKAEITVIGHSYGSLVTGIAAKQGLDADRIVFIGSPGPGAETAAGLHARPGTQIFAGAIEGDPVSNFRHFGNDPTDPRFGAIVFDAGNPPVVTPKQLFGLHSRYYEPGSESLANLGNIVSGRPVDPDHPSLVEHIVSGVRSTDVSIDHGVDWMQDRVHLPFIDRPVDALIDFDQDVKSVGFRIVEGGGELIDDASKKGVALYKAVTPSWAH